ncbi:RagB/SusD family nutrient uptake outer membrane protein [Flavobacterium reichenbachii]|uniref:Carbohydrate-binding protein SusD n=1 Tax=Flavobacterium reichenbachii TaxID=362418 RepID=A0A085ZQ03_9FLAO|nr:RagB/SusD family nutrient uptake outer membrane protein [Flavobacterium reichenbachii]KFF06517.1 carbohydrate-binding protein SusD [Flavobacterium reichenbachii]OXB11007.1 RagB/SusD family nutrient uptake outer membrane protein [Flavobacterium reichenbachii]
MKNIIKTILLSVVVFGMNSCTEEKILDLEPINQISESVAFSTPSFIASSMNGVYNAAALGQYNTTNPNGGRGYIWGAAFVEQGDCRGEDVVNTQAFFQVTYEGSYDANTLNNMYYWVDGFRLINRCNLMIEGVNGAVAKGIITQAVADDYIGQAKFLRAITHFELLNFFARPYNYTAGATHPGLPYREVGVNTTAEIASETAKPRNTVAECYTKILADLTDAEALITSNGFNNSTRVVAKATKSAAIAFKTRVYLHKRDWANVIAEGTKLTTMTLPNAYALTSASNGAFLYPTNLSNTESIFSIQHSSTANPTTNGALPSMYKQRVLIAISPIIWRNPFWLADDKRRQEGVMINTPASGAKYSNKYTDVTNNTDAAPVIRYAEVLLNMAEAQARLSNLPAALTLLNSVRNRSLATPATQSYTATSFTTNASMMAAIIAERRIEFLAEGRRWSDIQRLQDDDLVPIVGVPAKVANGVPPAAAYTLGTPYDGPLSIAAIPKTDRRMLWPIPQVERNTNPNVAQNDGWE